MGLLKPSVEPMQFGHVFIHNGRPQWDLYFDKVAEGAVEKEVGVTFCGNGLVGDQLSEQCNRCTLASKGKLEFHLHSEVF